MAALAGKNVPLSEGAIGASTAANTASLASSISCCVNSPDLAHSTAFSNVFKVANEFGSLRRKKKVKLITVVLQDHVLELLCSLFIHSLLCIRKHTHMGIKPNDKISFLFTKKRFWILFFFFKKTEALQTRDI